MLSLQETYSPKSICFGCGPANKKGLRIRSFAKNPEFALNSKDEFPYHCIAEFIPEEYYQAFPNVLNGGIIGSLLDCHSNWTAAYALMHKNNQTEPPCTVTADFHVILKRPTPFPATVYLDAWVKEFSGPKAIIEATLTANGKVCATCAGTFVAVDESHPAYHRW